MIRIHTATSAPGNDGILKSKIRKLKTECPYREGSNKAAFYALLSGVTTVSGYVTATAKKKHSAKDAVSALKRMAKFKVIKLV